MTDVIIAPRLEDPLSDVEAVISGGYFQVRSSRWNATSGQWISDAWPAPIPLVGSAVTVKLDASTVPYELYLNYPDGRGGFGERTEFRTVAASGTPVKWEDLVLVAGPGAGPIYTSDLEARVAALEALPPPSGGASTLATISDMTAVARTLNAKTTTGAMLTYLNAPAIGDAPTAHTHAVPGGLVTTGTPSGTTFLRGDGAWATPPVAGTPAWTDITGKPTTFPPSAHTHPASDITGLVTTAMDWLNITNRPHERFEIVCTGDVQLPRNYPNVTPATPVRSQDNVDWVKATAPSVSVAQVGDGWWLDV